MSDYDFEADVDGLREYQFRINLAKLASASPGIRVRVAGFAMPIARGRKALTELRARLAREESYEERLLIEQEISHRMTEFTEMYKQAKDFELRS